MRRSLRMLGAVAAAVLVLAIGTPTAQALVSTQIKCLKAEAKAAGTFVKGKLKAKQKCRDKYLKSNPADCSMCVGGSNAGVPCTVDSECPGGSCPPGEPANTIANLAIALDAVIERNCALSGPAEFGAMGFPGKCKDSNLGDGFTEPDLKTCIYDSHETNVDDLIAIEYGTTTPPLAADVLKCQKTISKNGAKLVNAKAKAVQKCRNGLLDGSLTGIAPRNCAISDSKTKAKIAKAESKTHAAILGKCTDPLIDLLDVCPGVCVGGANDGKPCTVASECPSGSCGASTAAGAADCIVGTHTDAVDSPSIASPANLIDYEYADPLACGDNLLNSDVNPYDLEEECDTTHDAACPGKCGAGTGPFPCLCTDIPRERVVEHANADLDNGWTGISHDSGVVEGGGYVADLYDCNGPAGPDTLCTVGPSCTGGAHAACSNDTQCGFFNKPCRKRRTAVGPHCDLHIQQACTNDTDCPDPGDFCLKTYHGPPLPLSAGGISVCVLNVFSEDVVGTKELTTGAGAVRLRQRAITHLGPSLQEPCPVCGGFCGDPPDGIRNRCTTNADCPAGPLRDDPVPCVTDPICSFGPNADKECRPDPPFGGGTQFFGNTSVDCPPIPPGISGTGPNAGIDILFNPVTTGTVTFTPSVQCDALGFGFRTCVGGVNEGKTCSICNGGTNNGAACTVNSQCPGGACNGGVLCNGGTNNGAACTVNSQCPGGACNGSVQCPGGTCNYQCWCPTGGDVVEKPNDCKAACVGGSNDAQPCTVDSECPTGFCHLADCRDTTGKCVEGPNARASCTSGSECPGGTCGDPDGANEGTCIAGPPTGTCAVHSFKLCGDNSDCQQLGSAACTGYQVPYHCCSGVGTGDCFCAFCDPGETCIFKNRQCFVNSGIIRTGVAHPTDPTGVAAFCEAAVSSNSVNATAGLPGPAALRQPETSVLTGLPFP